MAPGDTNITVERLRDLIGRRVQLDDVAFRVIEVLEDGPSVVLESERSQSIQPDQYGEAHRWVPHTLTVPIFTDDRTELNPDFVSLGLMPLD